MGEEEERRILPAANRKNVLVIGGGPAGMEAARVAALRGHSVTLYEKTAVLGGQLVIAAVPPGKDELRGLVSYYVTQMQKLDVKIHLAEEFT